MCNSLFRAGDVLRDFETKEEFVVAYMKKHKPHDETHKFYVKYRVVRLATNEEHEEYTKQLQEKGVI